MGVICSTALLLQGIINMKTIAVKGIRLIKISTTSTTP